MARPELLAQEVRRFRQAAKTYQQGGKTAVIKFLRYGRATHPDEAEPQAEYNVMLQAVQTGKGVGKALRVARSHLAAHRKALRPEERGTVHDPYPGRPEGNRQAVRGFRRTIALLEKKLPKPEPLSEETRRVFYRRTPRGTYEYGPDETVLLRRRLRAFEKIKSPSEQQKRELYRLQAALKGKAAALKRDVGAARRGPFGGSPGPHQIIAGAGVAAGGAGLVTGRLLLPAVAQAGRRVGLEKAAQVGLGFGVAILQAAGIGKQETKPLDAPPGAGGPQPTQTPTPQGARRTSPPLEPLSKEIMRMRRRVR